MLAVYGYSSTVFLHKRQILLWSSYKLLVLFVCCFQDKVAKAQETKDLAVSSLAQAIEDEKKEQWRTEGRSMLFDAKRVSRLDDYFHFSFSTFMLSSVHTRHIDSMNVALYALSCRSPHISLCNLWRLSPSAGHRFKMFVSSLWLCGELKPDVWRIVWKLPCWIAAIHLFFF